MKQGKDIFFEIAKRMAKQEAFATALMVVLWTVVGVGDWRFMLGLAVVRSLAWYVYVRALVEPIRAWQRAPAVSDAQLATIDEALQHCGRSLLLSFTVAWFAWLALSSVHAALTSAEVGWAEVILAGFLLMSLTVALAVITQPVIDDALADTRVAAAVAATERGLRLERPSVSLSSRLVATMTGQTFALTMILAILGASSWVKSARAIAVEEQLRAAEIAAFQVRHGEDIDPRVSLVDADDLPAILTPDAAAGDESIGASDPRGGRVLAAAPIGDGRLVLAVGVPDERLGSMALILFGIGTVVLLRGTASARIFARTQTAPLDDIGAQIRQVIDSGDVLARGRVPVVRNDELGRLTANFNAMLDMLAELAGAAGAVAKGDLRVELERPGDLYDAFRGMLGHLREAVGEIRRTALELTSTAAELHAGNASQQRAATDQAARMRTMSATVGSLATAAGDISQKAADVLDDAEQAAARTDEMSAKIAELGRQAAGIGELLGLIREVADRSDLLALNGALEATRAGESGRGFALVAAEMRRLAERVSVAVEDVAARLGDIERSSALTIAATEDTRKLVQNTADAARAISSVTQRQSQDTQEASVAVDETAAGVSESVAGLSQTLAVAEDLRIKAGGLETLTGQFMLS